jgi:(R,R)-butanediol dehydrogenase/meso-butanediol dehydrogenase/diacetyl reductase
MGHEFAGTVAEVGQGVDGLAEGHLPTDLGALVEPLAVAYHAVRLSGTTGGQTALVFGAGPIGLVTAANLRAAGAGQIVVVEPAAARKAKAPGAGADVVLDPTEVDVPRPYGTSPRARAPTSPSSAPGSTPCWPRPSSRSASAGRSSTSRSGATGRIELDDLVDGGFRQLIDHKEEHVKILVHP